MEQNFKNWVESLAKQYKQTQQRAIHKVDYELCKYHIILGREIEESSFKNSYGSKFYVILSEELRKLVPNSLGFSPRNLRYIQSFYILYRKILQQLVAKFSNALDMNNEITSETEISERLINELAALPWGHYVIIMDHCKTNIQKAYFYVQKAISEKCSRNELMNLMYEKVYEREGKGINNFSITLSEHDTDEVKKISKDPYRFNLLELTDDYREKEINEALVKNIEKTLIEMGKGYAFVGREYRVDVGISEFYIDLLFYYIPLHSYVVIEVKNTKFKPEYLGQLNFYVSAIDRDTKGKEDNNTIGILLCKEKDNDVVQYSLNSFQIPLGVSCFEIDKIVGQNYQSQLPTIEEFEKEEREPIKK